MVISKKKIFKTALLPEYYPRLKQLFGSGFANVAYLIAVVYNLVRIMPASHPYLKSDNIGKYSILQVIGEASNNIDLKKENIDQIIIFFAVLSALLILFVQFILLGFALVISRSYAEGGGGQIPESILDFFKTDYPADDIAFKLLNLVFGVPDMFGGVGGDVEGGVQTPIHVALQSLFEFYSYGMLIVASFIIIYLVATTIMETAQSGMPFGQRFNKTWVPVRIIIFFALLLPTTHGLNPAQYMTLMSAKLGSGLATQGWTIYNDVLAANAYTLTGSVDQNVAIPKKADLMYLPAFMSVVRTCAVSYEALYNPVDFIEPVWADGIVAWAVYRNSNDEFVSELMADNTYEDLLEASEGRDITLTFGVKDAAIFPDAAGGVGPVCGSLELPATDVAQPGAVVFRTAYYDIVSDLWAGLYFIEDYAIYFADVSLSVDIPGGQPNPPTQYYKLSWVRYIDQIMEGTNVEESGGVIQEAVDAQIEQGDWQLPPELRTYGWAGAGIWYNTVAEQNGALIAALRGIPEVMLYPRVMEQIEEAKQNEDIAPDVNTRFIANYAPGTKTGISLIHEEEIAKALNLAYKSWYATESGVNPTISPTGNAFLDITNAILGTQGLFEMCRNTNIHPLAQLSAVGKSMLDSSIQSFAGSAIFSLFGMQPVAKSTADAIASSFATIAGVGLLVGFILFYVLPFMPFIYFFFAVLSWIKTIFEAMVAMPLWALSHLRIDGDGVFGEAGVKGYFLIFEIFIRPILIVFGLIASIVIFAAMVKVLHQVFYLILANMAGHESGKGAGGCFQGGSSIASGQAITIDQQRLAMQESTRGPIDEFFFTILYTIIVYMTGTSCFKLIDAIPNNILRWVNAEIPSFGDNAGDSAEGLMKYVSLGGSQFGSQLGSGISDMTDKMQEMSISFQER